MGTHLSPPTYPSDSVMKSMGHHQILTGLPKHWPNKINQALCKNIHTEKVVTFPKGTTVDITKLWTG